VSGRRSPDRAALERKGILLFAALALVAIIVFAPRRSGRPAGDASAGPTGELAATADVEGDAGFPLRSTPGRRAYGPPDSASALLPQLGQEPSSGGARPGL